MREKTVLVAMRVVVVERMAMAKAVPPGPRLQRQTAAAASKKPLFS